MFSTLLKVIYVNKRKIYCCQITHQLSEVDSAELRISENFKNRNHDKNETENDDKNDRNNEQRVWGQLGTFRDRLVVTYEVS